jgi:hypothetical protein
MIIVALDVVVAAVLAFAAVLQYNDPDPLIWMAIYGAACVISVTVAIRRTIPAVAVLTVGAVALLWSVRTAVGVTSLEVYRHMFDAWEMKSSSVEEARESTGLMIVAAWMAVLTVRAWSAGTERKDRLPPTSL